jgi:hypothetical protein
LDRQASLRAKQERDEFLRQVGITADGERTQTTSAPTEWTLEDDGEPDIDFPQPVPGEKGVKIERLTVLRHDGGLVNYYRMLPAFLKQCSIQHGGQTRCFRHFLVRSENEVRLGWRVEKAT